MNEVYVPWSFEHWWALARDVKVPHVRITPAAPSVTLEHAFDECSARAGWNAALEEAAKGFDGDREGDSAWIRALKAETP